MWCMTSYEKNVSGKYAVPPFHSVLVCRQHPNTPPPPPHPLWSIVEWIYSILFSRLVCRWDNFEYMFKQRPLHFDNVFMILWLCFVSLKQITSLNKNNSHSDDEINNIAIQAVHQFIQHVTMSFRVFFCKDGKHGVVHKISTTAKLPLASITSNNRFHSRKGPMEYS